MNKYAQTAVDNLFEALRRGKRTDQSELPRIPNGSAGRGSTSFVDFHTTKPIYPADKCHLNAMVADTKTWEQSASFALDTHPAVARWVKNEHLGLRIPNGSAGRGSTSFVDFHTTKPIYPADKCHLNAMVADTKTWEQSASFALDTHPAVARWVKNEHLGLRIPYRRQGVPAVYIPDFIPVLVAGLTLLIEIKGQYGDDADLKAKAAEPWVTAVYREGGFGTWP